ncbi:decaprenyl-phosphate phosphoribosyltransferase [Flavihumibacter fluvii]|uniref:decaprenyl-phosphate phosphoribosyltransferase n=1 Tax=Flavihumibacter fluvii TaxID=2838157 RepID=UPI001BDEC155|nr:decaprenyl-phosphate phosphoribosyltransferase [Flavihumibacter fluvii]ULQ52765.1 decaprenyl-phosphate phosphoribosyltransferase [Flavihumibacter fluvii]
MVQYIKLLRPKEWIKNFFLFLPLFFAADLFKFEKYPPLLLGFLAFSLVASSIYIINDYRDIESDKKHPTKSKRPLASGTVSPTAAIIICGICLLVGFSIAYLTLPKFVFILGIYFTMNLAYSFGLKNIPVLDTFIVAAGFVLRAKAGAELADVYLSEWLTIMVFLLALFMALGKRRDDVLLKIESGVDMRKAIHGYNLNFLNVALSMVCAVIIVAYFMYSMSTEVTTRLGTYRVYYTTVFILAGIMRYLQIIYVNADSGSPTKILYKDRFIQISIVLWIASFYFILYIRDLNFFK